MYKHKQSHQVMNRKYAGQNRNGSIKVVKFDACMLLLLYSITESNISYVVTLLPASSPGARSATLRTCKAFHLQSPLHFANNSIANRRLSKELYCTPNFETSDVLKSSKSYFSCSYQPQKWICKNFGMCRLFAVELFPAKSD